jgi:F-type H+-transporting ATPase subunit b
MRYILVFVSAVITCSGLFAPAWAQPEKEHGMHGPGEKQGDQKKFTYEAHHQQHTLDVTKPEQVEEFVSTLKDGHVESVEPVKTVNILALKADLALWAVVVFLGLLVVLSRYAWQPMLAGLQKREDHIRGSVEEAKRTREEMEQLRARFKSEMDQAYAKIPELMDEARREAQQMQEEMRAKAAADIQTERQRLRHELDVARDQALQELWTQAAQLATLISAKAISRSLNEEDHRRLLDEALEEMRQARR